MDSIRIDTGVKRIAINDDPNNVIEFNPDDVGLAERFYKLIGEFDAKMDDIMRRGLVLEKNKAVDAAGIPTNVGERIKLMAEASRFFRSQIDYVFGEGTSLKVFGTMESMSAYAQFFQGITPYFKEARQAKVAKYTRGRAKRESK